MANKESTIGLPADPTDPEDFDVSEGAIQQALSDRGARGKRMGRPPIGPGKQQVTLRVDVDVLAKFRATGPGWQSRVNEALRAAAKL